MQSPVKICNQFAHLSPVLMCEQYGISHHDLARVQAFAAHAEPRLDAEELEARARRGWMVAQIGGVREDPEGTLLGVL